MDRFRKLASACMGGKVHVPAALRALRKIKVVEAAGGYYYIGNGVSV